jgi:hypothetical protein
MLQNVTQGLRLGHSLWIKSKWIRCMRNIVSMGAVTNSNIMLVAKHEGRRPLGRTRHRWEDNIKMDLKKEGLTV